MADMFDYIAWRGDLHFSQDGFHEVDALIFCGLSYIRYCDNMLSDPLTPRTLRQVADEFFVLEDCDQRCRVQNDLELLHRAAESERFGNCKVWFYSDELIPEQETQFAAMTFILDDGTMFLAFRGTDSTLVGWKEDFNMTFQQTIPAQMLAVKYVWNVAMQTGAPLRLGGHSKGGNLAVFAGARSSPMVQERILEIYNNDGPGFTKYLMGDPGYLAVVARIRTFIPQTSVIGMLLEHEEPYTVIRSGNVGVMQHDLYSWDLVGTHFERLEHITKESVFLDVTIKNWFESMTNLERNQLVDAMYRLLCTGGVDHAADIFHLKNVRNYLKTIGNDEELRRLLSTEFAGLLVSARKAAVQLLEERDKARLLETGNDQTEKRQNS